MKIMQVTAVVGMQGSIDRLTDIMERSFLPEEPTADPGVERLTRAVKSVEKDEGLTVEAEERAALISVFMANPTSINIYLDEQGAATPTCKETSVLTVG